VHRLEEIDMAPVSQGLGMALILAIIDGVRDRDEQSRAAASAEARALQARIQLAVRPAGQWLEMSIRDDGQGVPPTEVEHVFFAERQRVHALVLLRRRLQGLWALVSAGGA
jgi:hypothetical protein